jgi:hypothetical protein
LGDELEVDVLSLALAGDSRRGVPLLGLLEGSLHTEGRKVPIPYLLQDTAKPVKKHIGGIREASYRDSYQVVRHQITGFNCLINLVILLKFSKLSGKGSF